MSWINGRPGTLLEVRDRGLQYGDGLFETLRIRHGAVRLLDRHWQRLTDGCRRLGLPAPAAGLRTELHRAAQGRRDAVLKLIVTRGVGPRGYAVPVPLRATRVLTRHALSGAARRASTAPQHARLCRTRLGCNEALAGLKTLNRLESVLARAEWSDARIWEGLMCDTDGHLVCGTMSNFFMRRGPFLCTPRLDRCGVAGIMRGWVMEQAAAFDLRAVEGRLRWDDLDESAEIFMTNAVVGVVSIASIAHGRRRLRFADFSTADALRGRLAGL